MNERNREEKGKLKTALFRRAVGYDTTEVVEEFAETEEGEQRLTKRKVTTKNVPPDISAAKLLLELEEEGEKKYDLSFLSDEELQREKERLLSDLSRLQGGGESEQGGREK